MAEGEEVHLAIAVSKRKKQSDRGEDVVRADFKTIGEILGAALEPKIETRHYGSIGECDLSLVLAKLPAPKNISELRFSQSSRETRYKPFSPYPFISRDVALFVGESNSAADVNNIVKQNAGAFLVSSRLFDEFTKDGKKSLAFRLVFQSMERTLTDKEVNEVME